MPQDALPVAAGGRLLAAAAVSLLVFPGDRHPCSASEVELIPDGVVICGGTGQGNPAGESLSGFSAPPLPGRPQRGGNPKQAGAFSASRTAQDSRGAVTGTFNALVIFARFRGEADGADSKPSWADDLFDPGLPGSFAHFYDEMSRGQLLVRGEVLPKRYSSLEESAAYLPEEGGVTGDYPRFNLEILTQADADVDMGRFDNDGPDGVPNSGDDDGYVDVVFINLLTVPTNFLLRKATGLATLGFDTDFISDDPADGGGFIRVRGRFSGFGGTTQRGRVFSKTAATMSHEFAHMLGLPDLFDQSTVLLGGEIDREQDSAGIGRWGLMGLGTLGWNERDDDGPAVFSAWSLAQLGWLGRENENLVEVTESLRGLEMEQIDRGGPVYRIPVTEEEYFLIENRQNSGSFYNRNIPAGGLLVWHVDEGADNDEERHKQVDLVCADGLFADRGYPGEQPDPIGGRDNLDFKSNDEAYASAHNGNEGDATDPFDGDRFDRADLTTNPGLRAHARFERGVPLGIALENIRDLGGGRMGLDILVRQPVEGNVSADAAWSGEVVIDGDVVVEPGVRLVLEAGTRVRFSRGDSRGAGFDPGLAEMIVYGELEVRGDSGDPVVLESAEERPRSGDWLGLLLMTGGSGEVEEAAASGGLLVEHSRYGLLRQRLPAGVTTWSQDRVLPWDVHVEKGSELVIESGAAVRFAPSDLSGRGRSSRLTELVVKGALKIAGTPAGPVELTVDSRSSDSLWYGLVLEADGVLEASHLEIGQSGFALTGEVSERGGAHLENTTVRRTVHGINMSVFGELTIDGSTLKDVVGNALRASGTGLVRVRNSVIENTGWEGISLGNSNLLAISTRIESSGQLDEEDPRSGLVATGGRGQTIELWKCTVTGSTLHGLQLDPWEGEVQLHFCEITGNRRNGIIGSGLSRMVFEDVTVARNIGHGAVFADSRMEVWTTLFEDNVGTGLVLNAGATGLIDMSDFASSSGMALNGVRGCDGAQLDLPQRLLRRRVARFGAGADRQQVREQPHGGNDQRLPGARGNHRQRLRQQPRRHRQPVRAAGECPGELLGHGRQHRHRRAVRRGGRLAPLPDQRTDCTIPRWRRQPTGFRPASPCTRAGPTRSTAAPTCASTCPGRRAPSCGSTTCAEPWCAPWSRPISRQGPTPSNGTASTMRETGRPAASISSRCGPGTSARGGRSPC